MENKYKEIFKNRHSLLIVIHVRDFHQILENIKISIEEGADGVFLIDHGDGAEGNLLYFYELVVEKYSRFWVGLNFLEESNEDAVKIVWDKGVPGLWVDNAGIIDARDRGVTCGHAEFLLSLRKSLSFDGLYFAGVAFKYQEPVINYQLVAKEAVKYVDVITTSGVATGSAPDIDKISKMRKGMGEDFPFAVASGITPENVRQYLDFVDCFIVSTGVNMEDDFYNLNPKKVSKLVKAIGN